MDITAFTQLACPLDGLPLALEGPSWRCPDGHHFDRAKQGHTHLLPVQNKRSRDPGDSKAMVAARQRFLNAGFYLPIAEAVSNQVLSSLPRGADHTVNVMDAGSGEGYYLRQLARAAEAQTASGTQQMAMLGLDISKWAVLAAAKQDRRPGWVVGSNARIPVLAGTLDYVLCIFGFPVYSEFLRVLKPGGQLLQLDPGPNHLRELRDIIYPTVKPAAVTDEPAVPQGISAAEVTPLSFQVTLRDHDSIADLLAMTPHLYRASAEGKSRALALQTLTLTVDVQVRRFISKPDQGAVE